MASGTSLHWDLGYSSDSNGNITFDHVTGSDPALNNGLPSDYNSVTFSSDKSASDAITMNLSGWSNLGGTVQQETMQFWSNNSTYKGGIASGGETGSPVHAADNKGKKEFFLLSFTDANGNAQDIDLKGVKIKYEYKDGSTSNGPFDSSDAFSAIALDSMPTTGVDWDFSNDDVVSLSESGRNNYYALDNRSFSSNLWLIGFNTLGNDAFKFIGVKGLAVNNPHVDVSEPGALALFALGLAFMARRKQVS